MKDNVHHISEYKNAWNKLTLVDEILTSGGFGDRGIDGKTLAINYANGSVEMC